MSLKSGHRITSVTGRDNEKQFQDFEAHRVGSIRLDPDGWFFTLPFISYGDKVYDFKYKPTDVVIMTYPKCGTTWTQEIVWTMLHNPDLNNPNFALPINIRCPFIDADFLLKHSTVRPIESGNELFDAFKTFFPDDDPNEGMMLKFADISKDPRVLKTHLPLSLVNPSILDTCKVIYVARDPKAVAVSYYHHSRLFKGHQYVGTLSSFIDHFVSDALLYSPFWKHIKEAWLKRDHKNLHFLFYEDMKANPMGEIIRLSDFLECKLTENQINGIVNYTSFKSMKERSDVLIGKVDESKEDNFMNMDIYKKDGGFFRKGTARDWENRLTEEDVRKLEEWRKANTKEFDGNFKYASE